MSLFMQFLLYGVLFVGILFLVDAVFGLIRGPIGADDKAVRRRLLQARRVRMRDESSDIPILKDDDDVSEWVKQLPYYAPLHRLLTRADSFTTVPRLVLLMAVVALALFVGLRFAVPFIPWPGLLALALLVSVGAILVYVNGIADRRTKMFEEQLPDALDLMVRSLKIGHPLSSAMGVVAREMPHPIGTEFMIAFDSVTYGEQIGQAFMSMRERVATQDLDYLTVAIQIQQESGGNLAEVLAKLSGVIRDRFRMFRKVRAITTEGRLSAWFLSLFPLGVIGLMLTLKPDFYANIADFPFFPHLVALTLVLLVVNVIAMRIITSIKV